MTFGRPMSLRTILLCVLASLVLCGSLALDLVLLPHDSALGRDFSAFYAAGTLLRHGGDPYSRSGLAAMESHLPTIGDPRQVVGFNSYANPPLFAWAMSGLSRLTQPLAFGIWSALMALALLASMALLIWQYGGRRSAWWLGLALMPASVISLFLGQQIPLLVLSLAAAMVAVERRAPWLAGFVLGVAWVKPHLLVPLMVVMVALLPWRDGRRVLGGFALASAALGGLSWWLTGARLLHTWLDTLILYGHTLDRDQPALSSLAGLYLSVIGRPWSQYIELGCVAAWGAWMLWLVWSARRAGLRPDDADWLRVVSLALVGWLLLTPYTHPADLVLLAATLPALAGRHTPGLANPATRLALGLLLVAPQADLLGFRPNLVFTYSMVAALAVLAALRPWRTPLLYHSEAADDTHTQVAA